MKEGAPIALRYAAIFMSSTETSTPFHACRSSPTAGSSNATGGGPLLGPVPLPHIPVRTDDTPQKAVYFIVHAGMANARVPPLAPSRNGSPGPSSPPDAGRGFSCRLVMTVLPSSKGRITITGGPGRTRTSNQTVMRVARSHRNLKYNRHFSSGFVHVRSH